MQIFGPNLKDISVWNKIAFSGKLKFIQRHGSKVTGLMVKNGIFRGENLAVKGLMNEFVSGPVNLTSLLLQLAFGKVWLRSSPFARLTSSVLFSTPVKQ